MMATVQRIYFTVHAEERMAEMGVTPKEVVRVIMEPLITRPYKPKTHELHHRGQEIKMFVGERVIASVDVTNPENYRVLTVLWDLGGGEFKRGDVAPGT